MLLIEHDGKAVLARAGVLVPSGILINGQTPDWPENYPLYVKAQVLAGRRGKGGLVRRVDSAEQLLSVFHDVRQKVGSQLCAGYLLEAATTHTEQWMMSLDLDRQTGDWRLVFSEQGGMDVSSVKVVRLGSTASPNVNDLPLALAMLVRTVLPALQSEDVLSLEINPLAVLNDGSLMALDAKIEVDDAALFRHPEWITWPSYTLRQTGGTEREQAHRKMLEEAGYRGTLGRYVELNGDLAVILSGGGASLLAMDALLRAGLRPANYLEASGNPDPESLRRAAAIVLSKPGLKGVWIAGSFANFTDIEATVMAVLMAMDDVNLRVPVVIRRDGPRAQEAVERATTWAAQCGIALRFHRGEIDLDTSAKTWHELLK